MMISLPFSKYWTAESCRPGTSKRMPACHSWFTTKKCVASFGSRASYNIAEYGDGEFGQEKGESRCGREKEEESNSFPPKRK